MKKKKAYQLMRDIKPIEMPYDVWRFFTNCNKNIYFASEQASFGEDYGSIEEIRAAIKWFVEQFGGEVKWNE